MQHINNNGHNVYSFVKIKSFIAVLLSELFIKLAIETSHDWVLTVFTDSSTLE